MHHGRTLRAAIPARVRPWLLDPSSLTARLQRSCRGRFAVRVLGQGWQRPMVNEELRLGMRHGGLALLREVQLLCDGHPWVYARTVIPYSTLRGPQRRLARLGSRPLGAVLFADRSMHRDEVELVRIPEGDALHARATWQTGQVVGTVWGRRSVFRVGGKPLLVSEFFLPGIKEWVG